LCAGSSWATFADFAWAWKKSAMRKNHRKLRELKVGWNPEAKKYELVLSEEHVLMEIVDRLWLQAKIRMVRINQPVGGKVHPNENGIPDLSGELPRRPFVVTCSRDACASTTIEFPPIPLWIEVKRPASPGRRGGVPSPAQIRFIAEKKAAGCCAFFADSWGDVVRELAYFGVKLSA
jgi:hypothetical protein